MDKWDFLQEDEGTGIRGGDDWGDCPVREYYYKKRCGEAGLMDMWLCRMPGRDYKILPRYCVWMMFFLQFARIGAADA